MENRSIDNEIAQAKSDLAASRLRLEATETHQALTTEALNELEAKVMSMGKSPRYQAGWDQSLRRARRIDNEAHRSLVEAKIEVQRGCDILAQLKRQL